MTLDQIITEIHHFFTEETLTAALDLGGHLLTGTFLVQRYFPEAAKSKKAALAVYSGLLPDFDYFTLGLIPHKTATHTISFGAMAALNAYYGDREVRDKESVLPSLKERVAGALTSRWAKITASGVGLHLAMDYVLRESTEAMVAYGCVAAAAVGAQIAYNIADNRYEKTQKPQKIVPCVVIDGEGNRYWVSEKTQSHARPGEYHESIDYRNGKGLPLCFVPEYKYPTEEGRELVREFQTRYMPKGPSIWERMDDAMLKAYISLRNIVIRA